MKLTVDELQKYADELPIGYYANTRIKISIDKNAPTSYFMPSTREIYISLNGVNDSLKNVKDSKHNAEVAVRAHLYHELSHAILTPSLLNVTDTINVFEDERIETLLRNYYKKVNFRSNIIALCDYNGEKPTTNDEVFFYAVRFRATSKENNEKIDALIDKYKKLNWNSDWHNSNFDTYSTDIYNLYYELTKNTPQSITDEQWEEWKNNSDLFNGMNGEGDVPQEYSESAQSGEGANGESANAQGIRNSAEGEGEEYDEGENGHEAGRGLFEQAMEDAMNESIDFDFYKSVEQILIGFQKRNQRGGSAMQSYGGVFNPRNCARDDYRYFDRKTTVNGANPYGTVHLNLFIDNSGSFSSNAKQANKIIGSLCELERRYPFFTVDFAFCGDKVERVEKSKAYLQADEGTHIQSGAIEVVKSMQKKNTCVYNIVLYDGWASYPQNAFKHCYEPFDLQNTTLILDNSCAPYATKCENAKVIISNRYLPTLTKNIIKTLQTAFR